MSRFSGASSRPRTRSVLDEGGLDAPSNHGENGPPGDHPEVNGISPGGGGGRAGRKWAEVGVGVGAPNRHFCEPDDHGSVAQGGTRGLRLLAGFTVWWAATGDQASPVSGFRSMESVPCRSIS